MPQRKRNKPAKYCARCGECSHLEVHHKIALMDGGSDASDNLITLCSCCHAEWHALEMRSGCDLEQWINMPSLINFYGIWLIDWPDNISAKEFKEAFVKSTSILRSFKRINDE